MPMIADSGVELDALAKAAPEEQPAAVEAVKTGQARNIREALCAMSKALSEHEEVPRENPEEQDGESQAADPASNEPESTPHTLLMRFIADANARAGNGKKTRAATSRAKSAKPKAAAPAKEPAPTPSTGLGTPREQWIAATADVYKAPASALYGALMDTARLMNDARHMDEIPETKRVALLRKFAAALGMPYLLKDPADAVPVGMPSATKSRLGWPAALGVEQLSNRPMTQQETLQCASSL
jgi:hypothetical protein